jgi:hypothetical protein
MKMKNLTLKLSAVAVAALVVTGAQANGTVTPTATGATGGVTYAMENITAATTLTAPAITYTMGVGRAATGQDMTIIYTLPAGSTFNATPAVPTFIATVPTIAIPSVTLKRGGAGTAEVVYSVSIDPTSTGAGIHATDTFTLTGATIKGGTNLAANGATFDFQVKLLDQVETACVDNAGTTATCFATSRVATLAPAADFWNSFPTTPVVGVYSDSSTTTDVNATVPLAGFVSTTDNVPSAAGNDAAGVAKAIVWVKNTTSGVKNATNTGDYTLGATDLITITVTDPTGFLGLATGGLSYALATPVVFTPSGNTATRTNIPGNDASLNANRVFSYTSDATTPMGVSRVLSIAGAVTPAAGISHNFTGNSSWWTWGSNGTILETAMSAYTAGYNNRFVFMNYGNNDVTYSSTCLVETGKTAVTGTAASGTLAHGKQTVIPAANVCTISGTSNGNAATRAGVRFTINAPSTVVKGVYNSVATNGSIDSIELVRPTTLANQH